MSSAAQSTEDKHERRRKKHRSRQTWAQSKTRQQQGSAKGCKNRALDERLIRQTRAKISFSASQTGSPTVVVAPLQSRDESHNYENLGLQGFTQGVLGTVNSKSNIYHVSP